MPNECVVLIGDSQSVNPGRVAEKKLEALGYRTSRLSNTGKGPYDYVRLPNLWRGYLETIRIQNPTLIVLIFGTNDAPNDLLRDALKKLKNSVRPKVVLTGPPLYPGAEHQANGLKVQAIYREAFGDDFLDAYPYTPLSIPRDKLGLHFTLRGAETWGAAIADEVVKRLG